MSLNPGSGRSLREVNGNPIIPFMSQRHENRKYVYLIFMQDTTFLIWVNAEQNVLNWNVY